MVEIEQTVAEWSSCGTARAAAADREGWRHSVEVLCITWREAARYGKY